MTRVVIVGDAYYSDLSVGGGPVYPSAPGGAHPAHPIYNPAYPAHPIYNPPSGIWGGPPLYPDIGGPGPQPGGPRPAQPIYNPAYPAHPIYNPPPGIWGGPPSYVDIGGPAPQPGSGGTPVPPETYAPAPLPEELMSQYVVSTFDPKTTLWTTKSYPPPAA